MELIKKLRDSTGSGIVDCKKALSENNNDIEAAIKWLREKGILKAQKNKIEKQMKVLSHFIITHQILTLLFAK